MIDIMSTFRGEYSINSKLIYYESGIYSSCCSYANR
jgi:hypothetical protein